MGMTKMEKTLRYMQEHGSITTWEAIKEFGNTRLSNSIYMLKKKGYKIESINENFVDRFGDKSHYARYTLLDNKPEDAVTI